MKCDKSFKRSMLTVWGMKELGKGRSLTDVKEDMRWWMRKSVQEIKDMVSGKTAMNKIDRIADRVAYSMMAATKDLESLLKITPEWYEKQKKFKEEQEAALDRFNMQWSEAHADLEKGTTDLLTDIRDELVKFFNQSGKGVRKTDVTGGLVEVFIGNRDGVERTDSKVSAHVSLTFEDSPRQSFMLRNENLRSIEGTLSPKNTVQKLMWLVEKEDKNGFWDEVEMR